MPTLEQALPQPLAHPESRLMVREAWQDEVAARRDIGAVALSNLQEPLTIRNLEAEFDVYAPDILTGIIEDGSATEEAASDMKAHIENVRAGVISEQPAFAGNPFLPGNADKLPPPVDLSAAVMADTRVQELLDGRDMSEPHGRLREILPVFREDYTRRLRHGIALGYIPESVSDRIGPALDMTSVRIADSAIIDTLAGPDIIAYYHNTYDEIAVRHDSLNTDEELWQHLAHEFTHKISGGTFGAEEDGSAANRSRIGFSTELKPDTAVRTGLNEAMTQHITVGILTGDFETFDPDERADGDKVYAELP